MHAFIQNVVQFLVTEIVDHTCNLHHSFELQNSAIEEVILITSMHIAMAEI